MAGKVLLIEDEMNITQAVRFLLSGAGWQVSTHGSGDGAMEAIRKAAPDIVILDAMLPGRSGYDILRALRESEETRDLPVLMLTARGQKKDRDLAMGAGATGFMTKPFANAELLEAVRRLMERA